MVTLRDTVTSSWESGERSPNATTHAVLSLSTHLGGRIARVVVFSAAAAALGLVAVVAVVVPAAAAAARRAALAARPQPADDCARVLQGRRRERRRVG